MQEESEFGPEAPLEGRSRLSDFGERSAPKQSLSTRKSCYSSPSILGFQRELDELGASAFLDNVTDSLQERRKAVCQSSTVEAFWEWAIPSRKLTKVEGEVPSEDVYWKGNARAYLFYSTHHDIDESWIYIEVTSGEVRAYLDRRIWWSWQRVAPVRDNTNEAWVLGPGQYIGENSYISGPYDGDHRLTVRPWAPGTEAHIVFSSEDI